MKTSSLYQVNVGHKFHTGWGYTVYVVARGVKAAGSKGVKMVLRQRKLDGAKSPKVGFFPTSVSRMGEVAL